MSRRLVLIKPFVFMLFAAVAIGAEPEKPIALHPANPHYFVWRDTPTVLITSGEHYGALMNLDFDYARYFDELTSHGLNHTRTFTGVYREHAAAFGITDNTLAPKPDRFTCPWARSDQLGGAHGENKFDLTKWDAAYFARLRDFMTKARDRGIVVELTLFCPMYRDDMWAISPMNAANNINKVGACGREEVYTLKHRDLLDAQLGLVRKIVAELAEFDNLYYEVCNEPYFGGVTMDWQHRVIDEIVAAEKALPAKHLISLNIANGRKRVEQPQPAVSIFNFHYCVPPDTVAMNFGLKKVIGENETGFRGQADVLYRTEAWDFLLAGGGLYNNLDYSFTAKHPDGSFRDYKSPGGGSVELRRQLGVLKRFLDGFDFVKMEPDNTVVRGVSPKLAVSVLAQKGESYAVYLHFPLANKPKDLKSLLRENIDAAVTLELPRGSYAAQWIDTKLGTVVKRETFQHDGGAKQLASPRFADDIAVRLVRRD